MFAVVDGFRFREVAEHRLRLGHPRLIDHHPVGVHRQSRQDAYEGDDDGELDQREPATPVSLFPMSGMGSGATGHRPVRSHEADGPDGLPGRVGAFLRDASIFSDSSFSSAAVGWK